jgi:hypothetical protein
MAEASNKYWAWRPTMAIAGVTNDTPPIVSLFGDANLNTNAPVTIASLPGSIGTALNGNWQVTPVSRYYARFLDSDLTSLVSDSSGIITVTTPSPHGLTVGRAVNISDSSSCAFDNGGYPYILTSVPTSTTYLLGPTSGTNNKTCNSGNAPNLRIWSFDAYSLNGGTASGAYTSGITSHSGAGTMVATSNTDNFTEFVVPGSAANGGSQLSGAFSGQHVIH